MNPATDGRSEPTILHVDMDAFYVSVEFTVRPELRGKPVIVGGAGNRGVVAAASYAARSYGVHSAMPSTRARRLCPDAIFLQGNHALYSEVSKRVMELFGRYTPEVEPLSLDEAFLDVAGSTRLLGAPASIAAQIRAEIFETEGLTCSVGAATTKFLSKLASEAAKPIATRSGPKPGLGVKVVEPGTELAFLHPQPAKALWGVGKVTLEKLQRIGVETVGDLAGLPVETLIASLGKANGRHLHELANARDPRPVVSNAATKSVSHEETFASDLFDRTSLDREVVRMADSVGSRLRRGEIAGRTVAIKVRFGDFTTITRSTTLPAPTDSGTEIARLAKALLDQVDPSPGVRLLGVGVQSLTEDTTRQLTFDLDAPPVERRGDADAAIDAIRARFGADAIGPAVLADQDGIRVKRKGDQQWGPGQSDTNR